MPWRLMAWVCMLGGGGAAAWGLWILWRIRNEASIGWLGRIAHLLWLDRIHEHRDRALALVAGGLVLAGLGLIQACYLRWRLPRGGAKRRRT